MATLRLASIGIAALAGAFLLAWAIGPASAEDGRGAGGGASRDAEPARPAPHRGGAPGAADAGPGAGAGRGTTEPEGPSGEKGGARAPSPRPDDGCPYRGRQLELIV